MFLLSCRCRGDGHRLPRVHGAALHSGDQQRHLHPELVQRQHLPGRVHPRARHGAGPPQLGAELSPSGAAQQPARGQLYSGTDTTSIQHPQT